MYYMVNLRSRVKQIFMTRRMCIDGFFADSIVAGRILLLFTALLLLVMPWTESYWHFDGFLRGGQDLELGLLALITIFSLILVLSRHRKVRMAFLFAIAQMLSFALQTREAAALKRGGTAVLQVRPDRWTAPATYNAPIQI
uniref:Uncharacterized protein n=1 Tax=Paracidobacterium acidisoli TaxID=2303751 RepID=A0A372IRD8_9BACT